MQPYLDGYQEPVEPPPLLELEDELEELDELDEDQESESSEDPQLVEELLPNSPLKRFHTKMNGRHIRNSTMPKPRIGLEKSVNPAVRRLVANQVRRLPDEKMTGTSINTASSTKGRMYSEVTMVYFLYEYPSFSEDLRALSAEV